MIKAFCKDLLMLWPQGHFQLCTKALAKNWATQKPKPWFIPSFLRGFCKAPAKGIWARILMDWNKHLLSKFSPFKLYSLAMSLPVCCPDRSRPTIYLGWIREQSNYKWLKMKFLTEEAIEQKCFHFQGSHLRIQLFFP